MYLQKIPNIFKQLFTQEKISTRSPYFLPLKRDPPRRRKTFRRQPALPPDARTHRGREVYAGRRLPHRQEPLHHLVRGPPDNARPAGRLPRIRGGLEALEPPPAARKVPPHGNREHQEAAERGAPDDGKGRRARKRRGCRPRRKPDL